MLKRWKKQDLQRIKETIKVFSKSGLHYFVHKAKLHYHLPFRKVKPVEPESIPKLLRKAFEELGGAYVKLGQLLSIRPDLVPPEWCEEFRSLQDNLPAEPYEVIRKEIKGMGAFSSIEKKPIGSASIAQVHRAILKGGKKVVVKIQRPRAKERFEADMDAMHFIAEKLEKYLKFDGYSPVRVVEEFETYTRRELDFNVEATSIDTYYRTFREKNIIRIPKVYKEATNKKVLTMSYIPGIKLSALLKSKKKFDKKTVAIHLFDIAITQLFKSEVFHADLHPGNIIITRDKKIGLLDFGIAGSLTPDIREQGIRLLVAMVDNDPEEAFRAVGYIGVEREEYYPEVIKAKIKRTFQKWYGKNLTDAKISHMFHNILTTCVENGLQLPPSLVLLGKSLVTVEGTCLQLYPEFNFVEEARPYITELLRGEIETDLDIKSILKRAFHLKQFTKTMPRKIEKIIDTLGAGRIKIDIDDRDVKNLGRDISISSDRLSSALIAAAFVIAGSILLHINIPPLIVGYSFIALFCFAIAFVTSFLLVLSFLI